MMPSRFLATNFFLALVLVLYSILCSVSLGVQASQTYQLWRLPPGFSGPESLAFDCNGDGPYTGVSDGSILKWEGPGHGWRQFTVTSQLRTSDICDGSDDPKLEPFCGRPLGVHFDNVTCELYVADAYFGLQKVGRNGGVAITVASIAEGVPFKYTNALDIDVENRVIYFTDSSTIYQIWQTMESFESGDSTGRFMKYDMQTGQVTVLLKDLKFANGVALNNDKTYVLVAETEANQILKYWLEGPKANSSEVLCQLPGPPDNIKKNTRGEFWVGINNGRNEIIAVRFNGEDGRVLQSLYSDGIIHSVSEVMEYRGNLLLGSVDTPYIGISKIQKLQSSTSSDLVNHPLKQVLFKEMPKYLPL